MTSLGSFLLLVIVVTGELFHVTSSADILQQLANEEEASQFLEMVVDTGLNETLSASGPFTVFVPVNQAFAKLPGHLVANVTSDKVLLTEVLENHIVFGKRLDNVFEEKDVVMKNIAGWTLRVNLYRQSKFYQGFVTVNGKAVKKADLQADNGVIHFVSEMLEPMVTKDIPAVLTSDGRFGTLLTAIEMAGLGEMLTQSGPFTVFAPTDEAFDRIPQDTLAEIIKDTDVLGPILRRHVIPGKTLHAKGISWDEHETANGDGQTIATQVFKKGVIKVAASRDSSAFIIQSDLLATNGVVHVIDAVI